MVLQDRLCTKWMTLLRNAGAHHVQAGLVYILGPGAHSGIRCCLVPHQSLRLWKQQSLKTCGMQDVAFHICHETTLIVQGAHCFSMQRRSATCTSWDSVCTGPGAGSGIRGYLDPHRLPRHLKQQSRGSSGMRLKALHTQGLAEAAMGAARTGNWPFCSYSNIPVQSSTLSSDRVWRQLGCACIGGDNNGGSLYLVASMPG